MNEAENDHSHPGTTVGPMPSSDDLRERLWAYEDFPALEERQPFNVGGAFANLGFIGAAVRRTTKFWLTWALIGMLVGLGLYVLYPVSYQATVLILIKNDPQQDPISAMETDQTMAHSRTVASRALHALGLSQSVSSFQAAYTTTFATNQVLSITVSAPTGPGAVQRANALANQFLAFRASLLRAQQTQELASLAQQVPTAQAHIESLRNQVSQLQGQGGNDSELTGLQRQLKTAQDSLPTLEQTVTGLSVETQNTTSSMIDGSQVLDAGALLKHSKIKSVLEYALSGLIGGLAIGLGIVIVRELISDRLRRRDDIAAALGGPIRLSVGPVEAGRLPGSPRARAARERDLLRIAVHLRDAVPKERRGPAMLAVVAVDNAKSIAPAVTSMVDACTREGKQVVVADLTKGAAVARLFGADGPGFRPVRIGNSTVVTVVPDPDEIAPGGPLRPSAGRLGPVATVSPPSDALLTACRSADLLLTVAELDPALGGEYLATWATDAVVVITAGRTHASRAQAVGEMLRLAGLPVVSGVVVGADKTDESLGRFPDEVAVPPARDGAIPSNGDEPGAVLR